MVHLMKEKFKDNYYDGYGTVKWANGNVYVGYLVKNQMHGKGTYTSTEGYTYTGDFAFGYMTGQGEKKWIKEGTQYTLTGEFKAADLINGTMTKVLSNGEKYVAEYKNGKKGKEKKQD